MRDRIIRTIARYLTGIVFIFSGFVKAIDPLGSTYKFTDYFQAFGLNFLTPLAFVLAVLLSTTEFTLGLALIFRIRMKFSAWLLICFMAFFTILTLILALENPVTDCGCFGDALILTNWQTFFKNIILLIPAITVFYYRNTYDKSFSDVTEWVISALLFAFGVMISVYCYYNLPLIDFRPYSIGTDIAESMKIPKGAPVDKYKTVLVYEKNGVQKDFSLNSPEKPWSDSTWKWVKTKNILLEKGYVPPIHDFAVIDENGKDVTDSLINNKGYSLLVISNNINKANKRGLERADKLDRKAKELGYSVFGMTSSSLNVAHNVADKLNLQIPFFSADRVTLKTMIRCNPGVMLIKEGTVLGKWHYRNIPRVDQLKKNGLSFALSQLREKGNQRLDIMVVMSLFSLALLLFIFREIIGRADEQSD